MNWLKEIGLIKVNYKGELVPAGAGIIIISVVNIFWLFYRFQGLGEQLIIDKLIFISFIIGGVGFLDDIKGDRSFQGLKGHFSQLFEGKLTTGILKIVVIFLAGLFISLDTGNFFNIILNTGLLVLMTNFINLLDLRPGRAIKVFAIFSIPLFMLQFTISLYYLPLLLVVLIYLPFELQGKIMLGDTGANFLGAILGVFLCRWDSLYGKLIIVSLLFSLTILSEKISFTSFIARNSLLNWLDELGR